MKKLLLILLCIARICYAEVLIFTHAYNRPDFIEIQYVTFKKFLKADYKFVVFNDAPSDEMSTHIENTCKKLGLDCIRIPQNIHTYAYLYRLPREQVNHPCVRCANVVQYSLNEMGLAHNDLVMILDSDMFLVKDFDPRSYMHNYDLAGVSQSRPKNVHYVWNGLLFFDMRTLPRKDLINFNCGEVYGVPVDVGGQMHHYLKEVSEARVQFIHQDYVKNHASKSTLQLETEGYTKPWINFIHANPWGVELYHYGTFIHYRTGTNWDQRSQNFHDEKTAVFNTLITKLLAD